jgi:hypothetical protein
MIYTSLYFVIRRYMYDFISAESIMLQAVPELNTTCKSFKTNSKNSVTNSIQIKIYNYRLIKFLIKTIKIPTPISRHIPQTLQMKIYRENKDNVCKLYSYNKSNITKHIIHTQQTSIGNKICK